MAVPTAEFGFTGFARTPTAAGQADRLVGLEKLRHHRVKVSGHAYQEVLPTTLALSEQPMNRITLIIQHGLQNGYTE